MRQSYDGSTRVTWRLLDSVDSIHLGSRTVGVKFYLNYNGVAGSTINVVEQQGTEIRSRSLLTSRRYIFSPIDVSLFLSCDPVDYYDPRFDEITSTGGQTTTEPTASVAAQTDSTESLPCVRVWSTNQIDTPSLSFGWIVVDQRS